MNISACNRADGIVGDMKKGKATTNVQLRSDIGELTLVMTSSSVEELRLEPGDRVTALFREVDVMLMKGEGSISTKNRLRGRILDVKKGNVTAEIPLDVGAGRRIVAVIARTAAEEMGLSAGEEVIACVREGDLILAKDGRLSIRNPLAGKITGLRPGTVTTELTLDTGHGELHALLARSIADEMNLGVGQEVQALLRERDFLILSTT
ncbi:MAG TPA: TOBE domain-containing protein [Burkholderiales bacterium]